MRKSAARRVLGALAWVTAVVVLVGAVAGGVVLHQRGALNDVLCGGDCGDRYVSAPEDLEAPAPGDQTVSAIPSATADPAAVTQAVQGAAGQPILGPHVGVSVRELDGDELLMTSPDTFIPASTTKLLTGYAALTTLDPEERFRTTTVLDGDRLVLVGGGDPYLMATPADRGYAAPADLGTLADRTAEALVADGVTQVRLAYDDTLFTGPADNPAWEPTYAAQNQVSPITALWVDRGRVDQRRVEDPSGSAAGIFAAQLAERGVTVVELQPAPAPVDAVPVAEVEGPTVAQAVERMAVTSDNGAAEVIARHVALGAGVDPSFEGATGAVIAALEASGVETTGLVLRDGSGLSRQNRIAPSTLTSVVAAAELAAPQLTADLPVAGFTGTLVERFVGLAGRGLARVKTGALNQVHSLAGTVTTADGVVLIVAVMVDQAEIAQALDARAAVDAVVASLASCGCAA
ncbi:D-alanyl-D-alanine carboxypeptidase/D-alanyl-D-alanine-endopeptidase [Aeromicrobium sp.]|uniref:D-alanyl-D-alanine carboxypeptidase/D-alanyl-D-alanine endopeptidase n=1 Tax=Aeromicrobium sp. TaxID=1871063 RepID=UPI0025C6D1FE|nr:D-alanyl-D-alanine carboxypeptidase/D-alanyl-D-alanine-endopeptidase [Aeromicrobium sp.]MCK5891990.1 D-alanyl-D-alanine carboxypeptidase/D-alanyl-D-alanine-endopeptidase [Aeromicrobium sp.]